MADLPGATGSQEEPPKGGKGLVSQHSLPATAPGQAKGSCGRGISEKSVTQWPCQGLK